MNRGRSAAGPAGSRIATDRLSRWSIAILDAMLPSPVLRGDVETRRRGRFVAAINLAVLAEGALLLGVTRLHPDPWIGPYMCAFVLLLWTGIAAAFRAGAPLSVVAHSLPATLFVCCMGLSLASGGEAIGATMANLVIPLIAVVLVGRRAAVGWTLAVLAGLLTTAWLGTSAAVLPIASSDVGWTQVRIPLVMALVVFVASVGFLFEWLRGLALDEARASREALAANEDRYRALAETAGDVVTEIDDRMRFAYVSPNCRDLVGWSPEDLLGMPFAPFVHPDELPALVRQAVTLRREGRANRTAFRFRHRDGRWLHLDSSSRRYQTAGGEWRMISISRDVTELRMAERAMRRSERLASTGTLAAGIAHQINNPVGAILQAAEYGLLCLDEGDLRNVERALRDNVDQARRCGLIVGGLLRFARKEPISKQPEDLRDVLARACDLTASYARERDVDIEVSAAGEPLPVEMNAVEIEQVIVNLLRNAIEARSRSGRVDVSLGRQGELARLEIRDDGAGIADADMPHIFDPFYTTRLVEGGSGLGLSVVHGILDEHDGRIQVESEPEKGTRVQVDLPLQPAAGR